MIILLILFIFLIILIFISYYQINNIRNIENFYTNSNKPKTIARYSQKHHTTIDEKTVSDYNIEEVQMIESNPEILSQILD